MDFHVVAILSVKPRRGWSYCSIFATWKSTANRIPPSKTCFYRSRGQGAGEPRIRSRASPGPSAFDFGNMSDTVEKIFADQLWCPAPTRPIRIAGNCPGINTWQINTWQLDRKSAKNFSKNFREAWRWRGGGGAGGSRAYAHAHTRKKTINQVLSFCSFFLFNLLLLFFFLFLSKMPSL